MTGNVQEELRLSGVSELRGAKELAPTESEMPVAFAELKRSVHATLETYSNVHRGSGRNSAVS